MLLICHFFGNANRSRVQSIDLMAEHHVPRLERRFRGRGGKRTQKVKRTRNTVEAVNFSSHDINKRLFVLFFWTESLFVCWLVLV